MQATVSMQALLAYDPTLLDGMLFPDGMNADAVKATIVQVCAPFEILIPQPEICKQMLTLFSVRRKSTWAIMWTSTQQDYDLLDEMGMEITTDGNDTNTRTPDLLHTRTPDLQQTRTPNLTTSGQNGGSDSTQQDVAAFNSNNMEPKERQTTTLGSTNTVHSTGTEETRETGTEETRETGTDKTDITINRTVKTFGRRRPAGELLEAARKAAEFDAYTYIAEDVKNNFCIRVY